MKVAVFSLRSNIFIKLSYHRNRLVKKKIEKLTFFSLTPVSSPPFICKARGYGFGDVKSMAATKDDPEYWFTGCVILLYILRL